MSIGEVNICGPKAFPLKRAENGRWMRGRQTDQETLSMGIGFEVFPAIGGKEDGDQGSVIDDSKRAQRGGSKAEVNRHLYPIRSRH